MPKIFAKLTQREFVNFFSIIAALLLGVYVPEFALRLKFLGVIFINLLKVILVPLVFFSVTNSILGLPDKELLKKVGLKVSRYFLLTSSLASVTGLSFTFLFFAFFAKKEWIEKFQGLNLEIQLSEINKKEDLKEGLEIINQIFTNIFPSNFLELLSGEKMLAVILFSLCFGVACLNLAEREETQTLKNLLKTLERVITKITDGVIKVAPLGIIGVISPFIANNGSEKILELGNFFVFILVACLTHAFFSLALIASLIGKFNLFTYFLKVKEAVLVAFVTASSCATIPVSLRTSLKAGVKERVASFVLPIGATVNMDGSAIYQPMCLLFIIKVANLEINLASLLVVFLAGVLGSIGTSGIPWGSVIIVSSILSLIGVPDAYIGLFIIIDRFLDFFITAVNVWGDLVACKTIDSQLELDFSFSENYKKSA